MCTISYIYRSLQLDWLCWELWVSGVCRYLCLSQWYCATCWGVHFTIAVSWTKCVHSSTSLICVYKNSIITSMSILAYKTCCVIQSQCTSYSRKVKRLLACTISYIHCWIQVPATWLTVLRAMSVWYMKRLEKVSALLTVWISIHVNHKNSVWLLPWTAPEHPVPESFLVKVRQGCCYKFLPEQHLLPKKPPWRCKDKNLDNTIYIM